MTKTFRLLLLFGILLAANTVSAQRLQVVDNDGDGIAYASVMTQDAQFIGITDLDGYLADTKGADIITVSHVAYKMQTVDLTKLTDRRIVLEDSDFGLTEITVKPKPYVYVQTYYRMYMYDDHDGIIYYRAGITDNIYERQTHKLKTYTTHVSKSYKGIIKTVINMLFGSKIDGFSEISIYDKDENPKTPLEQHYKNKWKKKYDIDVDITEVEPGRMCLSDSIGVIGYVTYDKELGQRHYTYDSEGWTKRRLEREGTKSEKKRREKVEAKTTNKIDVDYIVYKMDEDCNVLPEDFMMRMNYSSDDKMEKDGLHHNIFAIQVYAIDRAYVDKDELKQIRKDNKIKASYANIRQFERDHKIPEMEPAVQKKLDELWKADSGD